MSEYRNPFVAALKRLFSRKPLCQHEWHTDIRLCIGSTLCWSGMFGDAKNSIARAYETHEVCSVCGKTRIDRGYRPRKWDEDKGYKWNDNDYPLDDHGEKLPIAPDHGKRTTEYFGGEKLTYLYGGYLMANSEPIPQGEELLWLEKSSGLEVSS